MIIHKGHRFRLSLSEEQKTLCARTAGICRWLWNLALEQRTLAWQNGRHSVGFAAQCAELPGLKDAAPWLREAPSHCLQQVLRDLDQAFQNFFVGPMAYPVYRKKFQNDSFRFPDPQQFEVNEAGRWIKLPKFRRVAMFNGRGRHALKLAGQAKSITVRREGKRWYASVLCEREGPEPKPNHGPAVGLDLGVVQAITLSTGEVLAIQGRTRAEERRLARLHRSLGRKRKGSRNRAKARARLAELQIRIARRRRDAIHKATMKLARYHFVSRIPNGDTEKNHGLIVIEDLRVKAMTASARGTLEAPGTNVSAKAGLNRAMLNVAFGVIRRQLEYKCGWYGSNLLAVNPAHTSQRCSQCGHTDAGNRRSQATFHCLSCGHGANADVNAARNILERGTAEGTPAAVCGAMPSGGRRSRNPAARAVRIPSF